MERSQMKNIILFLLAAVNVFLLAIWIGQHRQAARHGLDPREAALQVLSANGVTVEPDSVPREERVERIEHISDPDRKRRVAEGLLGQSEEEVHMGGVRYRSDHGEARFDDSGGFSIVLRGAEAFPTDREKEAHLPVLLDRLEITPGGDWVRTEMAGAVSYTIRQGINGHPLLDSDITVTFTGDQLSFVGGTCLFDTIRPLPAQSILSAHGALSQVLQYETARTGGDTALHVRSVQLGYRLPAEQTAPLIPVWQVETDEGHYAVHGETGSVQVS